MEEIRDKVEYDLTISHDVIVYGTVIGNVTVVAGGHFQLDGTVHGRVVLKSDSRAIINGTVVGAVINRGGLLDVTGVVDGQVIEHHGTTHISPEARVGQ
jgi:cytoskeletal protein CcmA (bactofilin family)